MLRSALLTHVPRTPPPRKPEDIDLVARIVVRYHKTIRLLDNLLEPKTNGPTEEPSEKIAFGSHAVVIVHILHGTVCRLRPYKGLGNNFVSAVELGDVCIRAGSLLAPGPVNENHDPFHVDLTS